MIDFKILLLVFKALNGLAPLYLSDCLTDYASNCSHWLFNSGLLHLPKMTYKKYGEAVFSCIIWNKLTTHVSQATSIDGFKNQFKIYFHGLAFN